MASDIECAVSGIFAEQVEEFKDDGLGGLPQGWTQLTVKRRASNPKYFAIQQLKTAMYENMMAQARQQPIPEEAREMQEKTPLYITTTEVIYIAPPATDPGIKEFVRALQENLSLSSFGDEEDDEAEEG